MTDSFVWKSVLLLVPILGMFLVGAWLTLRSGVIGVAAGGNSGRGYRIALENLTRMIVTLVAILGIFLAIQFVVGYRVPLTLNLVSR